MPGTAYISSCGNGAYCFLELNGPNHGQIWCSWDEEVTKDWYGNFYDFYDKWIRRTEVTLERYTILKNFKNKKKIGFLPRKYTLEEIAEVMQCDYVEHPIGDEIWILFNQTPGKVILNKKRQVKNIDLK